VRPLRRARASGAGGKPRRVRINRPVPFDLRTLRATPHFRDLIVPQFLTKGEFADCLILARHRRLGCTGTATFDTKDLKFPDFVAV
jgi:hypothetical protein